MDSKVSKLAKLLGTYTDLIQDYYENSKKELVKGIYLEFSDVFNLKNEESLKSSFLASLKPYFLLMSNNNILRDSQDKIALFEDDLLEIKIWEEGKEVLAEKFKINEFSTILKDKLFNSQLELVPQEKKLIGKITLIKPAVQRTLVEKIQETTEQMVNREIRYLKESFLIYLQQASNLESLKEESALLFHRLKIWGYNYDDANFPYKKALEVVDSLSLTNPGFEDLLELEIFRKDFFKKVENHKLLKEVSIFRKKLNKKMKKNIKVLKDNYKAYSSLDSIKSKNS